MTLKNGHAASKLGLRIHLLSFVVGILIQVVLWGLLTPNLFFWPLWSVLAWGIGLVFHVRAVRKSAAQPPWH
ncbi:2TM domain-containing protein [Catellatospora coxensis]|uniref:2TM domain-containing protein n=1 Tax=Catellatospora coxensis TaxID=310354 RepID=A0A8J3KVL0_9ACTN|nr:2TM domain-containing protein [Catellatospora coxensis]GIG07147.1 hypothetical protein Cco03nite_38470 [Catellatospora coxensis]